MVVTVTSFLGASRAFAQTEETVPPLCFGDECPGATWWYDRVEVMPGWLDYNYSIDPNCRVMVDFKWTNSCGKCFVSIEAYKYASNCFGSNITKTEFMNFVLVCIMLRLSTEKGCGPTKENLCVDQIRVSTGACERVYKYEDAPNYKKGKTTIDSIPYIPIDIVVPAPLPQFYKQSTFQ